MAANDTVEPLPLVVVSVNKLWYAILHEKFADGCWVSLGEHMRLGIPKELYIDKEVMARCSKCSEGFVPGFCQWRCQLRDVEKRGFAWLLEEMERVYDEHRHDGSKVKSAGKQ